MTDERHQSARAGDTSGTFGFRDVTASERQGLVNRVFASVAERYDLMNDLMSGGLHRLWKHDFVATLNPPMAAGGGYRLVDVAGGTGDVVLRAARHARAGVDNPEFSAVLCDISPEMLDVGRRRVEAAGLAHAIDCIAGNAEALPFADRSFDAYTIAFGIRNVTHIDRALTEAHRVLKLGGRFLCLEFSECQVPMLDRLYDFHSFEMIPRIGQMVAGDRDSYQYLVESIRRFPKQEQFAAMLRQAGFERVTFRNLTGGIAAIHSGWKL
ncbi:MAG: bifunctional demethylmenaquinone methyltransferase/2-methoxy-6-polyprenyl-1,4-benzoquinol methylase UbiE [Hyphomicrobiaceae bacterium]